MSSCLDCFAELVIWAGTLGRARSLAMTAQSACELVHRFGELDVKLGHAAGIMGRQRDIDGFVDIETFGMMVELLRHQGDPRHEAESLAEIRKHEFLADRVATADFA